ncbi:ATP-binding cassette domain-containing protein [Mycoplasmopsis anatis]|uniref:ABC transporter ATP binding protein n=1 Tax=Mycoplasmopsis anatis 1340 TaxID=1034808 RepID=F9QE92_9BACT|nr:ABC transporter ATP-binding protein [Mycoplasmopsis anatis]EGS28903.1 ABC transporter ATP binding protein [Mycoplasmopsis anatis 1340]VEU73918.1 ABC transporter ATP-binding protein [Mycoplasmopsis anatis]
MKLKKYFFLNWKLNLFTILIVPIFSVINVVILWLTTTLLKDITSNSANDLNSLIIKIAIYASFSIISLVFLFVQQKFYLLIIYRGHYHLRQDVYRKIANSHPRDIKNANKEEILNTLETDCGMIGQMLIIPAALLNGFLEVVGIIVLYSFLSWQLLLIFLGITVVKVIKDFLIYSFYGQFSRKESEIKNKLLNKVNRFLSIYNLIIFSNKKQYFVDKFTQKITPVYSSYNKNLNGKTIVSYIANLLDLIIQISIFIGAFFLFKNGKIGIELLILSIVHFGTLSAKLSFTVQVFSGYFQIMGIWNKIQKFLAKFATPNLLNVDKFEKIELKNINLSFDNKKIFENFNLTINKGDKVLLLGKSGCGKSTLAKLMLNLYDNYEGEILVNGTKITKNDSLSNLFNYCSVESQNTLNVDLLQNQSRSSELKELFNANFIINQVDENNNYSTGEQQRINLLNSFYVDKEIMILDESLSNLDKNNRDNIMKKIFNLDKTVIMISHHIEKEDYPLFTKVVDFNKK